MKVLDECDPETSTKELDFDELWCRDDLSDEAFDLMLDQFDEITGEHDLFAVEGFDAEIGCEACQQTGTIVYPGEHDADECPTCGGTGYLTVLP